MNNENFITSTDFPETPKKGNIFLKFFAGIIILAVTAIVMSLATRIWDPLWNPFRPEPEEVLTRMLNQMEELKTYHNKTAFAVELKNKTEFKIEGNSSTNYDKTDLNNPKLDSDFNSNFSVEGMQFSFAGKVKTIGETSYFKLTTVPLPILVLFGLLGIDFQQFEEQWVKFDKGDIKEIFPSEIVGEFEKELERQKEIEEKIKKRIADKKLYFLKTLKVEELADEKIGEVKTYHYIVALNKEEVKKIILELIPELLNIVSEREGMPIMLESQKEELQENINQFFDKIGEIEFEVWIGKEDFYLYKLNFKKEIDLAVFEENEKGIITIEFSTDFDKFNQPVEITAPEEFKTIKEILIPQQGLFEPMFNPFYSPQSRRQGMPKEMQICVKL